MDPGFHPAYTLYAIVLTLLRPALLLCPQTLPPSPLFSPSLFCVASLCFSPTSKPSLESLGASFCPSFSTSSTGAPSATALSFPSGNSPLTRYFFLAYSSWHLCSRGFTCVADFVSCRRTVASWDIVYEFLR
ncbi:hypothetical protein BJ875DRAFT_468677 [Amylocarpus encephaloides]|uniref:Secreted protein n=1 Tax=Amylocarpus encephaloides TaxID=45428 RepID=A0A9P7YDI4_9HELO|nr:hypothetical protein BJ875DRAFT_468677 [Amylocarpus encephaloides]